MTAANFLKAETYDLKLPEGYEFDPELRKEFNKLCDEACLVEEEAQAFLDLHVKMMEKFVADYTATQASATAVPQAGTYSEEPIADPKK